MRDLYSAYYDLADAELKALWDSCTFAFDASTLLNLYGYSLRTRDNFEKALRHFEPRIWLPYQAGLEYQGGRLGAISKEEQAYERALGAVKSIANTAKKAMGHFEDSHPIRPDEIARKIGTALEPIVTELESIKAQNFDFAPDDPVRAFLEDVFRNRIGVRCTSSEVLARSRESDERAAIGLPPGLGDAGKRANRAGDYLIWCELLELARRTKLPVLFITDDAKDWLSNRGQEKDTPNPRLVDEMLREAGVRFHVYRSGMFIDLALESLTVAGKVTAQEAQATVFEVNARTTEGVYGAAHEGNRYTTVDVHVSREFVLELKTPHTETKVTSRLYTALMSSGSKPVNLQVTALTPYYFTIEVALAMNVSEGLPEILRSNWQLLFAYAFGPDLLRVSRITRVSDIEVEQTQ